VADGEHGDGPPTLTPFEGRKTSDDPGSCPDWKAPEDALGRELKQSGRVTLYGINFDSDSDHLRDESKPTLDAVVPCSRRAPR